MIVLTGVYAGVKSMQRKKEVASETIIHTVAVPKISLKKTEWVGKKRFVDCEFEPIKGAKRYYIAMSSNRNYTDYTEISGEPDNTKNIVFRIEQSRWKAGHPEYVRIRAQLSGNKRFCYLMLVLKVGFNYWIYSIGLTILVINIFLLVMSRAEDNDDNDTENKAR